MGGRGGSTALGNMLFDRNFQQLKSVKGYETTLREIDQIVENRPESARAVQLVIGTWLEKGKPVSTDGVLEYNYL